jgi:hypothetical protein
VSIQACGGESIDHRQEPSDLTGGTLGGGGTPAGGRGGVAGSETGGVAGTLGAGTGGGAVAGTSGTDTGGTAGVAAGAGGGGASSCEDVRAALHEELQAIQRCSVDSECGQPLQGTSCGCTRDLVARLDADTTRFNELLTTQIDGRTCSNFGSECDCPRADGFECRDNQCNWRYVADPPTCENATIGMLCVVGPDDGMLDVGDPLTIMVGASGCYSSSCTKTVIGECAVGEVSGGDYVATAQICLNVDSSGDCTDDCGGAGSPRCESEPTLTAGTHTVRLGAFSVTFDVPSSLSGASCSGLLE